MEEVAKNKWNACLQYIQSKLPVGEYSTWFEPLALFKSEGNKLTISVPNEYVGNYIRENHRALLQEAVNVSFGQLTQIFFRDEQKMAEWAKAQEQKRKDEQQQQAKQNKQHQLPPLRSNLNSSYSFDRFVEGESNKLAHAVAVSISEHPGQTTFNPFFLYGPPGYSFTVKFHFSSMSALKTASKYPKHNRKFLFQQRFPDKLVLFVSAHVFKTQFTDSVIHNTTNDFINFYQSIDVLIIDDIQEITTAKTQQAFFHIFNHLQQNRRQLVITCDRPPVLFEGIEDRMLTRFKWGMVAEMEKPDTKLRKAILESKIRRDGLTFPDEVVQYVAQNAESSVRELEGIVNGIMAYSIYDNCDIDLHLAARVVARIVNMERKELTVDDIVSAVCQHFGTKQREVMSKSRKPASSRCISAINTQRCRTARLGAVSVGATIPPCYTVATRWERKSLPTARSATKWKNWRRC